MNGDVIEARFLAAQALAREAGGLARRMLADRAGLAVEVKGRQDVVSVNRSGFVGGFNS